MVAGVQLFISIEIGQVSSLHLLILEGCSHFTPCCNCHELKMALPSRSWQQLDPLGCLLMGSWSRRNLVPFKPQVTCPSSLESTLVNAFKRVFNPFPIQPIGPLLLWEWTSAMIWFTVGVWLSDLSSLSTGATSLGVVPEMIVQLSLLPAANGCARGMASLSVPKEAMNKRWFWWYFFSLPWSSFTTYVGLSPLHQQTTS